jgi:hypothetical protein
VDYKVRCAKKKAKRILLYGRTEGGMSPVKVMFRDGTRT